MNQLLRLKTILTLSFMALLVGIHPAHADREPWFEIGAFVGAHFFSTTNEIGRPDGALEGSAPQHSVVFGPRLGLALGRWVTLEAEAAFMPTKTRNDLATVYLLSYRGHILLHLASGSFRPFILGGGGGLTSFSRNSQVIGDDTDGMFHAGAGLKWDFSESWTVRLDGRVLFPPSTTPGTLVTTDFEALLGFSARLGGYRTPPPAPVADRDGDGIPDDKDKCPTEAEDMDGFQDDDGCPDADNDNDGVPDVLDKCPNDAGPKEAYGCPDKDSDGDGIPDRLDKCVNEPETKNGYQDDDGCPDEIPQAVKQFTGVIEGIYFKTGKAELTSASETVLNKAVEVLKQYPDIRLEIQGHTDSTGKHEKNMTLSQARAEAVRQYVIKKGIEEQRLTAAGYGPDKPIDSNKTKAGRAKNRRVEFQLITK